MALIKNGLTQKAIVISKKNKILHHIKVQYTESLPINSKILFQEQLSDIKENDYVIINKNVFKVVQIILHKHPIKKTYEYSEFKLGFIDTLNKLPLIEKMINEN